MQSESLWTGGEAEREGKNEHGKNMGLVPLEGIVSQHQHHFTSNQQRKQKLDVGGLEAGSAISKNCPEPELRNELPSPSPVKPGTSWVP